MQLPISFNEKYRPKDLPDLILPDQHGLAAAFQFCANPFPSAWLHYGRPGTGKTSLARIMASRASRHPLSIRSYSGADLTSDIVRQLTGDFTYWPLYGGYHSVIVNEADSIPRLAQVRLLDLLERLEEFHAVLVFTSNDDLTGFEDRFLSRVRPQLFTTQGLAEKAIDWLLRIAEAESIPLSKQHARRLVKNAKNNLRTALQALELLGAETGTSSLLNSPLPNLTLPEGPLSACEPLANRRQTANLMLHPQ